MPEIFRKMKDMLLGVDVEDEDDDYDYEQDEEVYERPVRPVMERPAVEVKQFQPREVKRGTAHLRSVSTSNVIDLHKKSHIGIVMPRSIEDAREVIENTKNNIISVVNLEGVDGPQAQRIADFLSGSADALDGAIRRLSHDMFVIAPQGVEIKDSVSSEIHEEIKSFGLSSSSWLSSAFK